MSNSQYFLYVSVIPELQQALRSRSQLFLSHFSVSVSEFLQRLVYAVFSLFNAFSKPGTCFVKLVSVF